VSEIIIDKRLVRTYFSKKHPGAALFVSLFMLGLCLILSRLYWLDLEFSPLLSANKEQVFHNHEYWRLFTTTFVHGDMGHWLANAYMLGILGFFVYMYFGLGLYPVAAVMLSGLVNYLTIAAYHPQTSLVGASGMVYLLAGFWLTMFIFIERKRHWTRRLVIAAGAGLLILFPTTFETQVSYRAHFVGFVVGMAWGIFYFALNRRRIRAAEVWEVIIEEHPDEPQGFIESPPH
jgi:rhomboid protease GluP